METGVLFLDGDLAGQMLFGIPNISEYKRILSMDDTLRYRWCGEDDCCEMPTEPDVDLYYIVALGRYVRVATLRKERTADKERLLFQVAELAYKYWQCSPMAQWPRWNKQPAPTPVSGSAHKEGE